MKITSQEKKSYVLAEKGDLKILFVCKELEKLELEKGDKAVVGLIKSQLQRDWRKPLLQKLSQLAKRYGVKE